MSAEKPPALAGGVVTGSHAVTAADWGKANFVELREAEVQLRRIYLPGTSVNRAFEDAGDFVGWHPVRTCDNPPRKERTDVG